MRGLRPRRTWRKQAAALALPGTLLAGCGAFSKAVEREQLPPFPAFPELRWIGHGKPCPYKKIGA
jgi:hypothetical protein